MRGTTISIKDPMVKGEVAYDIPIEFVQLTTGMKSRGHRPCLCKLYQEGRCKQKSKCKSYHVDPDYIAQCRAEYGVALEENFITEVVVCDGQNVFAVRFPAVLRTRGLDEYKADFANGVMKPKMLCEDFGAGGCRDERNCNLIHVKQTELKGLNAKRLRTPCCMQHGDRYLDCWGDARLVMDSGETVNISLVWLAGNEALHRVRKGQPFTMRDVCLPHITGRCKYGRACGNLHICRLWWQQHVPQVATPAVGSEGPTPPATPPATPPPAVRKLKFATSAAELNAFPTEESFGLPVWDERAPPSLDM